MRALNELILSIKGIILNRSEASFKKITSLLMSPPRNTLILTQHPVLVCHSILNKQRQLCIDSLHFLWRYSHPSSHHVQRIGQHGCCGTSHGPRQ